MKRTLLAWFIFFGGFTTEMAIDYALRVQDGDIKTGGIPEPVWFMLQIALAVVSLWLAFTATKPLDLLWRRLLVIGVQAVVGFVLSAFAALYYVVGTGIDSL